MVITAMAAMMYAVCAGKAVELGSGDCAVCCEAGAVADELDDWGDDKTGVNVGFSVDEGDEPGEGVAVGVWYAGSGVP